MLYRFAKAEAVAEDKLAAFPDAASVADWAKDAMNWAVATGLINGVKAADGTVTLDAQSGATRGSQRCSCASSRADLISKNFPPGSPGGKFFLMNTEN